MSESFSRANLGSAFFPPRLSRIGTLAALGLIALIAAATWLWAAKFNYIPCYSDCGETFIAHFYARQFDLFGLHFGLLEDHATSPLASAHPYYYTHNANMGGYSFVLYQAIGLTSVAAKQFMVLLTYCGALYLVFEVARYYSRSAVVAIVALIVAATDFGSFVVFSLHALRVWSWLSLAGILLFAGKLAERDGRRASNIAGLAVFDLIAFCVGYEFWIISSCMSLCVIAALGFRGRPLRPLLASLAWGIAAALLPFFLRQIHVMAIMGFAYWSQDFIYSFAIKLPLMGMIFRLPTLMEIDAFYTAHNVMRPPTAPDTSISDYRNQLASAQHAFIAMLLPKIGTLSFILSALGMALAAGMFVAKPGRRLLRRMAPAKIAARVAEQDLSLPKRLGIERMLKLHLGLAGGLLIGGLAILKMVIPFYLALSMPLFALAFVLAKGFILGTLVLWTVRGKGSLRRGLAALFAFALIADHTVVQSATAQQMKRMETRWIPLIQDGPAATYAVSFIAPVVAAFTKNWVVGLTPSKEPIYFQRLAEGQPPLQKDDLFWFGERDIDSAGKPYIRPDYWLYFPIDQRAPYFSPTNACSTDYLYRLYRKVGNPRRSPAIAPPALAAAPALRNAQVQLVAGLANADLVQSVDIEIGGMPVGTLGVNCIHSLATGTIRVPAGLPAGAYELTATLKGSPDPQKRWPLGSIRVADETASADGVILGMNQLSVPEVLAKFPQLDVVDVHQPDDVGTGYMLIRMPAENARLAAPPGSAQ